MAVFVMAGTSAIEKIRNMVMSRSGLYFKEHDMSSLERSTSTRMTAAGIKDYAEYYRLLTSESPDSREEFTELLNLLTNKHTHFFRHHAQFTALRDHVLPEILKRKAKAADLTIKVLSAGCATGEEAYSIAMVILDMLGRASPWKVSIVSADISTEALAAAKKGVYPIKALASVEKEFVRRYVEKYCLMRDGKIHVSPVVKNFIRFRYLNLVDYDYPRGFDIIFCRNVTIYFEREMMKKVIEKLYQSLNEVGYLFGGGAETLYGISDKFEMVDMPNALVYKKAPPEAQRAVKNPSPQALKARAQRTIAEARKESPAAKSATGMVEAYSHLEKAKKCLLRKDYASSIKFIGDAFAIEPMLAEGHTMLARIYLNQDKLSEARHECKAALDIDPLSADTHYLLGIIYRKKGRDKDALNSLKKTVYLYPHHSLAYFDMANLYGEKDSLRESLKHYMNTLKALELEPEDHFNEVSGGLSKKILSQVSTKRVKELSHNH